MGGRPRRDAFQPFGVILVDTSAWIEFLRNSGSPVCSLVNELLASEIAICNAVRMEVLAGARGESHLQSLRRLLARAVVIPTLARLCSTSGFLCKTQRVDAKVYSVPTILLAVATQVTQGVSERGVQTPPKLIGVASSFQTSYPNQQSPCL